MESPIKWLGHDELQCTKVVDDGIDIIGVIRAEIGDDALLIHPTLYNVSKERLQAFKEAFYSFLNDLREEYGYEHWYALTDNSKLVRMITGDSMKVVKQIDTHTLYEGVL
jgi:hypothetical protein